ncbi:lipopolysaccharide kinase InaA family protein [Akkermansiaceae bacterium]|nr:lipopolysaccharide kinase InaA family protein [Akkermansiaceae bacterium]
MTRFTLHPELSPDLARLFREEHRSLFKQAEFISQNKERTIRQFESGGNFYIVKRYGEKKLRRTLQSLLGMSQAVNSFKSSQKLSTLGIRTPRHIFLASHLGFKLRESFLIMEKSHGRSFHGMIVNDSNKEIPDTIIRNIAQMISRLHCAGYAHGDLHSGNILVDPDQTIELIDLDGITTRKRSRKKDLSRLLHALRNRPKSQQRLTELIQDHTC